MVGWRGGGHGTKGRVGQETDEEKGPQFLILSCPVKKGGIPPDNPVSKLAVAP